MVDRHIPTVRLVIGRVFHGPAPAGIDHPDIHHTRFGDAWIGVEVPGSKIDFANGPVAQEEINTHVTSRMIDEAEETLENLPASILNHPDLKPFGAYWVWSDA
jgi:hypothetical protein